MLIRNQHCKIQNFFQFVLKKGTFEKTRIQNFNLKLFQMMNFNIFQTSFCGCVRNDIQSKLHVRNSFKQT